jgi:uncharacterized membrane protein YeaQ/YmgE (transglycosylase-associated protein family)
MWFLVIIVWIICGCVCEYLGNLKGQKGCFLYGLLLGIIGVIIVLCLKDKSGEIETNNNIDKYEQLEKLQVLKNNGTITDMEYEIEKQKLLK